jgi:hypothetical protein
MRFSEVKFRGKGSKVASCIVASRFKRVSCEAIPVRDLGAYVPFYDSFAVCFLLRRLFDERFDDPGGFWVWFCTF